MHAVVGRSTVGDFDQARAFLREEGIPRLSQMPGFISGHWIRIDDTTGASLLLFESEEAAQQAAERFRANMPPTVTPIHFEVGEVVEHT